MQKARNAINFLKVFLIICLFTSCKSKSKINIETDFLEFYISNNYNTSKGVILHSDNSNEYILKALKRHSMSNQEKDTLTKELLIENNLKQIKTQTFKNTKWTNNIEKLIKGVEISSKNINAFHISKPIFINKYCLAYSYKKTNDIYFIPSIEVFIKNDEWHKIGNIKHFK